MSDSDLGESVLRFKFVHFCLGSSGKPKQFAWLLWRIPQWDPMEPLGHVHNLHVLSSGSRGGILWILPFLQPF